MHQRSVQPGSSTGARRVPLAVLLVVALSAGLAALAASLLGPTYGASGGGAAVLLSAPSTSASPTDDPTASPTDDPTASPTDEPTASPTEGVPSSSPVVPGVPSLRVDRETVAPGSVLAFSGSGLPPGRQVSVVLDEGVTAAGPFQAAPDGSLAGVITVPMEVAPGEHQLRVFGLDTEVTATFAVTGTEPAVAAADEESRVDLQVAILFAAAAGLVLLLALVRVGVRWRRSRRVAAA